MDKLSMSALPARLAVRVFAAFIFISLLLFLAAGTLYFWNAWLFLGALFLPDVMAIIYLFKKEPELIPKRLKFTEREKIQKFFNLLYGLIFVAILIITGLDFRYQWSTVPFWLVISTAVVMILAFLMIMLVFRQNHYASRIIEIQEGQKVIDTGFYSQVRHPMYLFVTFFFCSMPLVLGSYYAFVLLMLVTPPVLLIRILNEEKVLRDNLSGYRDYMQKVRYRLIPFVW